MSSDSELSSVSDSAESIDISEGLSEEWGVIDSEITPYEDEPLAEVGGHEAGYGDSEEERDLDGLTPAVLEMRYERTASVDSWLVKLFKVMSIQLSYSERIVYDHLCCVYYSWQVSVRRMQCGIIGWITRISLLQRSNKFIGKDGV